MNQPKKIHPALAALIVIALLGVVATAAIVINNNNAGAPSPNGSVQNNGGSSTDPSAYKDGTYSATGSYISPGGRERIDLTVTIQDGVITSTSLAANEASGGARDYIQRFASGYEQEVVGKSVNEVELSRVAGSSLTSIGFNDALDQIKDEAAA